MHLHANLPAKLRDSNAAQVEVLEERLALCQGSTKPKQPSRRSSSRVNPFTSCTSDARQAGRSASCLTAAAQSLPGSQTALPPRNPPGLLSRAVLEKQVEELKVCNSQAASALRQQLDTLTPSSQAQAYKVALLTKVCLCNQPAAQYSCTQFFIFSMALVVTRYHADISSSSSSAFNVNDTSACILAPATRHADAQSG